MQENSIKKHKVGNYGLKHTRTIEKIYHFFSFEVDLNFNFFIQAAYIVILFCEMFHGEFKLSILSLFGNKYGEILLESLIE